MFRNFKFIIALLSFWSFTGFSQSFDGDFEEIVAKMEAAKSVSIEVDVKVYTKKGGTLTYTANASVDKMEAKSKSVLAEMEFIVTDKYFLKIDHEEKAILIYDKKKGTPNINTNTSDVDVEALMKFMEENNSKNGAKTKLISSVNAINKYGITGVKGIKEIIVELNMNLKSISSIIYEYGTENSAEQYVVLKYKKFAYDTNLSHKFDLSKYFKIVNNTYVLSPLLKGYQIYTEE